MEHSSLNLDYILPSIKSLRFGRNVIYEKSVASTNNLAKKLLSKDPQLPMIITADEQTRGRGRMNRSWYSPANIGMLITVVFPEADAKCKFGHYNFLVSLVIASAVESLGDLDIVFKWPNDILLSDKKFCGILSELTSGTVNKTVVMTGFGINVNNKTDDFPEEFRSKATSLFEETGKIIDRDALFIEIVQNLNSMYALWENQGIEPIFQQWLQKCSTPGKTIAIKTEKGYIEGEAESINQDGSLNLKDSAGHISRIYAGDLEYVVNDSPR